MNDPWQGSYAYGRFGSTLDLFQKFGNCQPLPLFPPELSANFRKSLSSELLLAVDAYALRFRGLGIENAEIRLEIEAKMQQAGQLVMQSIATSKVGTSHIQTLCLLSMLEFSGRTLLSS